MAKFQLNPKAPMISQGQPSEHVRIGPISLFALVVIICLAVLAVLSFTTANASLVMSQRQATATGEMYLAECAAQEFLAGVDDVLAGVRGERATTEVGSAELVRDERGNAVYDENGHQVVREGASRQANTAPVGRVEYMTALSDELIALRDAARDAAGGVVEVSASTVGDKVTAEFACENGRTLDIVVAIRSNGTYRVDRWKVSAVQNEEEPAGQLLIID